MPLILIIEDETPIAQTVQYALETEGFKTLHCTRGSGSPDLLSQHPIDLIILDIGLPDINGMELCKEIRRQSDVPIIFLTARADEVDRVVGLEIGADDYLIKPFSPRELSARVKAVLRRTRPLETPAAPEAPTKGPFRLDEERYRIFYYNAPLDLSRHEYRILKTFIHRPGRVFSRDQLMESAWDAPEASQDRTVDAHIKNIRVKLKQIRPQPDPIRTHRGIGYSLREDLS